MQFPFLEKRFVLPLHWCHLFCYPSNILWENVASLRATWDSYDWWGEPAGDDKYREPDKMGIKSSPIPSFLQKVTSLFSVQVKGKEEAPKRVSTQRKARRYSFPEENRMYSKCIDHRSVKNTCRILTAPHFFTPSIPTYVFCFVLIYSACHYLTLY